MNILNTVLGALGGNAGGNPLMAIVTQLLAGNDQQAGSGGGLGGLGGLLQQFQQNGLGDAAQSWIGTGANLPISADQLTKVLGSDRIADLARQAGLSAEDVSGQLANILPNAVDKLTPNGQLPQGNPDLSALTSVLGSLFGK